MTSLLPLNNPLLALLIATLYLTHCLVHEDGPLRLFERIRELPYSIGEMAGCIICAPFWVGMVVLALSVHLPPVVDILALAGIVAGVLRIWKWVSHFLELLNTRFYLSNAQKINDQVGGNEAEAYLKFDGPVGGAMAVVEYAANEAQKAN